MGHHRPHPQSFHQLGGFKIRARENGAAQRPADALALERAYAIVPRASLPRSPARSPRAVDPTIGIGAGSGCDGQVLSSTTCSA
jgi:3-methyl-2-oxobutanoate hydroxymethyltransferase